MCKNKYILLKSILANISWRSPLKASLNLLALSLVTEPTRTSNGSIGEVTRLKCLDRSFLFFTPLEPLKFLNDFNHWRGYRTKVFNKPPIETSQTVKTFNFCYWFWYSPFLNSFNLSLIHLYTFYTNNISKKNNFIHARVTLFQISI